MRATLAEGDDSPLGWSGRASNFVDMITNYFSKINKLTGTGQCLTLDKRFQEDATQATAISGHSSIGSWIDLAKVAPWERLFHNLWASMKMDLAKEYPPHIAAKWVGNSVAICAKHYFKPTEADFLSASGGTTVGTVQMRS